MPLALLRRFVAAILPIVLPALLAACAATDVRQRWSDPVDQAGPPRKLVVFVVIDEVGLRRMAENQLARGLPHPPEMVAGHALGLDSWPEQPEVWRRLAAEGFDAALVARLVSRDTTFREVPPQAYFAPDPWLMGPYLYRPWYPYYRYYPGYSDFYATPGYIVGTTHVVVETQLYRLPAGQPVWAAITDTADPASSAELVEELVHTLTRELRAARLLPPA